MPIPALQTNAVTTATTTGIFVKNPQDTYTFMELANTAVGATFTFEGTSDASPSTSSSWFKLANIDRASGVYNSGATGLSPTDSTAAGWDIPSQGLTGIRCNVSALTSGTFTMGSRSLALAGSPLQPPQQSGQTITGNLAVTGTTTVTSSSASALTVGRQGATNPQLQVDASTASVLTGLKVKGAGTGAGLALTVVESGGTNNSLTVDAMGSGTITLNGTTPSTGFVQIGGAASGSNATGLKVTPAAAASGLAIAVVSTGTDESMTLNAKGAGNIGIGSVSTGLVVIGRGVLKTPILGLTKTDVNTQNAAPTIAQWLGGYITHNSQTGAGTLTTPTGANISGGIAGVAVGDSFVVMYQNRGNQTVTLTAGDGNVTLKGTVAIPTLKTTWLLFSNTGANTWDVCQVLSA